MKNQLLTDVTNYELMVVLHNNEELLKLGFNVRSKISEIFFKYNPTKRIMDEINYRISFAPKREEIKKIIINEIISEFEITPTGEYLYDGYPEVYDLPPKKWSEKYLAYQFVKRGIDAELESFSNQLIRQDKNGSYVVNGIFLESRLMCIAEGVAMAYLFEELQNKWKEETDKSTVKSKQHEPQKYLADRLNKIRHILYNHNDEIESVFTLNESPWQTIGKIENEMNEKILQLNNPSFVTHYFKTILDNDLLGFKEIFDSHKEFLIDSNRDIAGVDVFDYWALSDDKTNFEKCVYEAFLIWINLISSMGKICKNLNLDAQIIYDYSGMKEYVRTNIVDENSQIYSDAETTKSITHKQQMILLQSLGLFDSPIFSSLNTTNKGKLLSQLLGRSEKNCKMFLTYIDSTKNMVSMDNQHVKTKTNLQAVISILKEVGCDSTKLEQELKKTEKK